MTHAQVTKQYGHLYFLTFKPAKGTYGDRDSSMTIRRRAQVPFVMKGWIVPAEVAHNFRVVSFKINGVEQTSYVYFDKIGRIKFDPVDADSDLELTVSRVDHSIAESGDRATPRWNDFQIAIHGSQTEYVREKLYPVPVESIGREDEGQKNEPVQEEWYHERLYPDEQNDPEEEEPNEPEPEPEQEYRRPRWERPKDVSVIADDMTGDDIAADAW